MNESFGLCGVCYQISFYSNWRRYNWDDEHEHIAESFDDYSTFYACPVCGYHHIDDDSDPGVWEGSLDEMLIEVKRLIADK